MFSFSTKRTGRTTCVIQHTHRLLLRMYSRMYIIVVLGTVLVYDV